MLGILLKVSELMSLMAEAEAAWERVRDLEGGEDGSHHDGKVPSPNLAVPR